MISYYELTSGARGSVLVAFWGGRQQGSRAASCHCVVGHRLKGICVDIGPSRQHPEPLPSVLALWCGVCQGSVGERVSLVYARGR